MGLLYQTHSIDWYLKMERMPARGTWSFVLPDSGILLFPNFLEILCQNWKCRTINHDHTLQNYSLVILSYDCTEAWISGCIKPCSDCSDCWSFTSNATRSLSTVTYSSIQTPHLVSQSVHYLKLWEPKKFQSPMSNGCTKLVLKTIQRCYCEGRC